MRTSRTVHVYRPAFGDCSNGGVSGRNDILALVGTCYDGEGLVIFSDADHRIADRAVVLSQGPTGKPVLIPVVVSDGQWVVEEHGGPRVASGNYGKLDGDLISLHDRFETWAEQPAAQ